MKYEFTQFETDAYGGQTGNKISTSFHADTLDEVIERMHYFLKGSGFFFDGNLEIVPEEKISLEDDDAISINLGGGGGSSEHSPYYYDFDRNRQFNLDLGAADSVYNVSLDEQNLDFTLGNIELGDTFVFGDTMAGRYNER